LKEKEKRGEEEGERGRGEREGERREEKQQGDTISFSSYPRYLSSNILSFVAQVFLTL
jgi:hypothetical protein